MIFLKQLLLVFLGFSSGAIISAGIFAFITAIGVVPRLAQKTKTEKYTKLYEQMILAGGVFGGLASFYNFYVYIGVILTILLSFCSGVFIGALAASLSETLKVIPIMARRVHVQTGLFFFIMSLAMGKTLGSILYFAVKGFAE